MEPIEREIGPEHPGELDRLRLFSRAFVHAMKNYLTGLSGYHQILEMKLMGKRENLDHAQLLEFTREAEKAVDQAERLLRSVATWGQSTRIEKYPLSLTETVNRALVEMDDPGSGRERVRVEAEPDLPKIPGDPVRLTGAIQALIRNALYASEKSSEPVRVRIHRLPADASGPARQRVDVHDAGEGMEDYLLPRTWIPILSGHRFPEDPTDGWPGHGLGLPRAFSVAAAHDGRLLYSHEPGTGTTFSLVLPE